MRSWIHPGFRELAALMILAALSGCSVLTSVPVPVAGHATSSGAKELDQPPELPLEFNDVPAAEPVAAGAPAPLPYLIRLGDVFQIEVAGFQETSAATIVMPDGNLYYNSVPGFFAAGRTLVEVEAELRKRLADIYPDPVLIIRPVRVSCGRCSVLGEVETPGEFDLIRPTSLRDAVALAGGLRLTKTSRDSPPVPVADLSRSILIRKDRIVPVDFGRLIEDGDPSRDVLVWPGDVIVLPRQSGSVVEVQGSVSRPGAVPCGDGVSLLKAISSAGGLSSGAYRGGILLYRDVATARPRVAQIDLDLVLLGKNIVTLQSDDLVWVPAAPLPSLSQVARETLDSARISMAKDRLREAGTASSPVDPPKVVAQAQESSENQ